ncbi:hypothetical protein A6R73_06970 [Xanthomonas translucens pv. poae]|uniref:Uncharacterized protein n=1 Tax=Xanthomonas graminis pv. poae TaxID=227946 RepID=A0A199NXT1_9XANT|nr:hypothetical protein A6R73_06970 [Xanthomonas translucens pv. poae]
MRSIHNILREISIFLTKLLAPFLLNGGNELSGGPLKFCLLSNHFQTFKIDLSARDYTTLLVIFVLKLPQLP